MAFEKALKYGQVGHNWKLMFI